MTFESVERQLEGLFDKPRDQLPRDKRRLIEDDLLLLPLWDHCDAQQRQSLSQQWDCQHDPATDKERDEIWEWACECERLESEIAQWESALTPTASDMAVKEKCLAELLQQLSMQHSESANPVQKNAATAHKIIASFVPKCIGEARNVEWWQTRMRNASDYTKLKTCRAHPRRGRTPSTWYSDQIAAWLIDTRHMLIDDSATILRNSFEGFEEKANLLELTNRN